MLSLNPDSRAPTQVARGGALPGNHRAGKTSRLQSALIWRLGPSGSLICPKTHTGSTWLFPACVVGKAWGICLWESRGALRCINPEFPRPWYHFRPSRCVSRPHGHSRPLRTHQAAWLDGRGPGCGLGGLGLHPVDPLACAPLGDKTAPTSGAGFEDYMS